MSEARITCRRFAQYAAYMASHASKWAAECMDGEAADPMRQDSVDRFTRRMLQWLEAMNSQPISTIQTRVYEAVAILQRAPDLIGGEGSKRQISDVSTANKAAWAVLTEGLHPASVHAATPRPLSLMEQIKLHVLTMGAPGELTVEDGLSRILRICIDGGATAKLDELQERKDAH